MRSTLNRTLFLPSRVNDVKSQNYPIKPTHLSKYSGFTHKTVLSTQIQTRDLYLKCPLGQIAILNIGPSLAIGSSPAGIKLVDQS